METNTLTNTLTKEQKLEILMKLFYNKETNKLDLSNLDCKDINIDLSNIKARCIFNISQKADTIYNDLQKAEHIYNNDQKAINHI